MTVEQMIDDLIEAAKMRRAMPTSPTTLADLAARRQSAIEAVQGLVEACRFVAGRLQDGDCEYDDVASMVLNLRAALARFEATEGK